MDTVSLKTPILPPGVRFESTEVNACGEAPKIVAQSSVVCSRIHLTQRTHSSSERRASRRGPRSHGMAKLRCRPVVSRFYVGVEESTSPLLPGVRNAPPTHDYQRETPNKGTTRRKPPRSFLMPPGTGVNVVVGSRQCLSATDRGNLGVPTS